MVHIHVYHAIEYRYRYRTVGLFDDSRWGGMIDRDRVRCWQVGVGIGIGIGIAMVVIACVVATKKGEVLVQVVVRWQPTQATRWH